jgi:hypothetical protein
VNIIVGGVTGVPAERVRVVNNYVYAPIQNAATKNQGVELGYGDQGNRDLHVVGNYIVSQLALRVYWWNTVECRENTIYTRGASVDLKVPPGANSAAYQWDNNTYITSPSGGPVFRFANQTDLGFQSWKTLALLDINSRLIPERSRRSSKPKCFVRLNKYEAGRGHIIVFNWNLNDSVDVDVSNILKIGNSYEVLDAQNYFGDRITSGVYHGSPISIPMRLTQISMPIGNVERVPRHTAPEFGAFVIRKLRGN